MCLDSSNFLEESKIWIVAMDWKIAREVQVSTPRAATRTNFLSPDLTLEPLATYYLRRARARINSSRISRDYWMDSAQRPIHFRVPP